MVEIKIKRKSRTAIAFSVAVMVIFSAMQAMEINGATDSPPRQTTINVTVAQTINFSCTSPVNLGSLIPGNPVTGSNTCTMTTNAESGYDLKVKRDGEVAGNDTTLDKIGEATTNITDRAPAWDPTANVGAGNATLWAGGNTGLGFTVFASTATKTDAWWGTGTSAADANNKYAGLPYLNGTTYYTIMDHDTYASGATTTSIGYKLDVPGTQKSGTYDGTVTFLATVKP